MYPVISTGLQLIEWVHTQDNFFHLFVNDQQSMTHFLSPCHREDVVKYLTASGLQPALQVLQQYPFLLSTDMNTPLAPVTISSA